MNPRQKAFYPGVLALVGLIAIPACDCQYGGTTVAQIRERPVRRVVERVQPSCTTVALPTGERGSSVLELEKCAPGSIRANVPFEYTINVRNLRDDVMLRNVLVRDEIPSALKIQSFDASQPIPDDIGPRTEIHRERPLQRVADPFPGDVSKEDITGQPDRPGMVDDDVILDDEGEPRDDALIENIPGQDGFQRDADYDFEGEFQLVGDDGRPFGRQGNVLTFDVGQLGPGQTWRTAYTAVAVTDGDIENCLTADFDVYACLTTNVTAPELRLTASAPEEFTICVNNETTLQLTLANVGTGVAEGVRIETQLSPGLELVDGEFTRPISLRAGERAEYNARVRVLRGGEHTITARAFAEGGLTAEAQDVYFVARQGAITLRATGPEMEYIGVPLEYQIEVGNEGDARAADATVEIMFPGDMEVVNAGGRCEVSNSRAVFKIGTIPPGEVRPLHVSLRTSARNERTVRTVVSATAVCSGSESVVLRSRLEGVPALLVEAVDKFDPRRIGQHEEYEVVITNQGSAPETNVMLTAELPPEMSYERATGPTQPRIEGNVIRFEPLPVLAPGQQQKWTIIGLCNTPGDVRFQIRVDSDQHGLPVRETEATRIYTTNQMEGVAPEGEPPIRDLPPDLPPQRELPPAGDLPPDVERPRDLPPVQPRNMPPDAGLPRQGELPPDGNQPEPIEPAPADRIPPPEGDQ